MGSQKATSDILLYAEMLGPSVMRLKNGSLLTGFRVKGPDLESAPPEVWASSSAALNDALLTLDHGWTVHFETTRLPSAVSRGSDFLDPTCRLIDEERRRAVFFETEQWLFLTQAPPWSEQSPTLKNLKSWLFEEPRRSYEEELRTQLDRFERTAERFANSLCAHLQIARFRSEPGNDELLQALYHCLTGRWQQTRLPEAPVCLDVLLAEDWLQGDPLTLGKRLVRAITLRGYPSDTFPGVLSALRALPFELRWSQRFIVKDYQQSEALLKKEQRRWQQRTRSFASQVLRTAGRLDQHALERANELDAALGDLNAGAVLYGHHTSVLLISGESPEEIEARSALVERSVQTAGYIAHVETYNGLEAFIGSLPGHTRQNVRKPVIHSLNVADLLAISREWEGEPHCPSPFFSKRSAALAEVRSSSGARFFLNLHVGDVGHTLMLGPTGAGKSTLLAFLASQFLQYAGQGAQVFAFDKGRSLFPLCAAVKDGAHVDFGAQVPELCPLEDVRSPKARAWAGEWIEQLLLLQGAAIGAEHALGRLVSEAAQRKAVKPPREDAAEQGKRGLPPSVRLSNTSMAQVPAEGTASVINARESFVRDIVNRVTAGLALSADAREELLAEGRLGLLEAHREFDPKHRSGANLETFAFLRVHGRVQEAFAGLGGFPRAVYRAAKKEAAMAREQAHGAGQVHTKEYLAQRVCEGADLLHLDPFTGIGLRLEKNAVRAAIEQLPDAQQRQVLRLMYVEGRAQSEVCEVLRLSKTRISRFHSAGVETVQKLLLLGSALEQKHVVHSVAQLSERRPREVLLALYRDRLDYPSARSKLGVAATELEELHQAALAALIECLAPAISQMSNQDTAPPKP